MYFVIEHQTRPDGTINVSETSRSTLATALSHYHERYAKMCVTDIYSSASLMLVDANLNVIQHDTIQTLYAEEETE